MHVLFLMKNKLPLRHRVIDAVLYVLCMALIGSMGALLLSGFFGLLDQYFP